MSKKIIKAGYYSLHIITSISGVIIIKVYNRETNEQIENSIFTEVSDSLEIYLGQYTSKVEPILNYLNQN
jgi:fructose 1,6-bisphosphatase